MSISEFKKKIIEMKTLIDEDDDLEEKKDNSLFIDANQIMDDYHIDCSFWWDEHYENPSFEEHLATIKDQITLLSCVKRNRKRKSDGTYRIEIPTEYDEENVNFVLEGFQKLAEILENYKRICDRLKIIEALRSKLSEELDEMNKVFEQMQGQLDDQSDEQKDELKKGAEKLLEIKRTSGCKNPNEKSAFDIEIEEDDLQPSSDEKQDDWEIEYDDD